MPFQLVTNIVALLEKNHASGIKRSIYKYCLNRLISKKLPPVKNLRKLLTFESNLSIQITIMTHVFSSLTYLSRLGGSSDIEPVKELLENGFRLGGGKALEALKIINSGRANFDNENIDKKLTKFIGTDGLIELLDCMVFVAREKGEISDDKLEFITDLATDLGFQPALIKELESRYELIEKYEDVLVELTDVEGGSKVVEEIRTKRDPVRGAFKILGLDRNSSNEEIKARYKKVIFDQHPDRLAANGLSGRELEKARARFTELLSAYELIRTDRKFR